MMAVIAAANSAVNCSASDDIAEIDPHAASIMLIDVQAMPTTMTRITSQNLIGI
jgi:hypothetical protein